MTIKSIDCVRIEYHTIIFIIKIDLNGSMKGKHKLVGNILKCIFKIIVKDKQIIKDKITMNRIDFNTKLRSLNFVSTGYQTSISLERAINVRISGLNRVKYSIMKKAEKHGTLLLHNSSFT